MPSLFNMVIARQVEALVEEVRAEGHEIDDERMGELTVVIHAACWLYSSRRGSTAQGMAWMELMDVLRVVRWETAERGVEPVEVREVGCTPEREG